MTQIFTSIVQFSLIFEEYDLIWNILINFRNKYLGHGTVFSEEESKKIYELYEPIFVEMLNQCEFLKKLTIVDQKTKNNINGYKNSCSGKLTIKTVSNGMRKLSSRPRIENVHHGIHIHAESPNPKP